MNSTVWTVPDVLSAAGSLPDTPVVIRAFLYGPGDTSDPVLYLLESDTHEPDQSALIIRDERVTASLLAKVPSWVGGKALFQDDVEVVGILRASAADAHCIELTSVSSLVLLRDGERYEVV